MAEKQYEERKEEIFQFLDNLRESGGINMFGAAPVVQDAYGLTRNEARSYVTDWMRTYSERHPQQK